jgi:hypothetical protein
VPTLSVRASAPWLAALFVLGMFAGVLALRWHAGFSNVDDYTYALQTRTYRDALALDPGPLGHAWKAYGANSPLVPMLALPIAAVDPSPNSLVLVQLLPLLLLLGAVRSLLGVLGLGATAAWTAAALIVTLPPVLGYAAMYHFAVAATGCAALAAAAYARSDGLLRRRPALLLGLALGVLALSRVVAPAYVLALCLPLAVDSFSRVGDRAVRARNGALVVLVAAAVSAPWWLIAGERATDYLTSRGYGETAGGAGNSWLDVLVHRLTWTATESGWLLAIVVALLLAWAVVCVFRRAPGWRLVVWLLASSVLGFVILGTSRNPGTAFALPFVVLLCCVAVWGIHQLRSPLRPVVVATCAASLLLPALALLDLVDRAKVDGRDLWQVGTPGLTQARAALGCSDCAPPDSDALSDRVLDVIGTRRVLLVRDDAVLNAFSLRAAAARRGSVTTLLTAAGPRSPTRAELSRVDQVLGGGTLGPYHGGLNALAVAVRVQRAGFTPVFSRRLSGLNNVVVWRSPVR